MGGAVSREGELMLGKKKDESLKAKAARTTAFVGLVAAAAAVSGTAAQAQTAPAPQATAAADEETVVVTGSILHRNANSISPVGTITADDLAQRGQNTITDVLQTLPGNSGGSLPASFSAGRNGGGGA